MTRRKQGGLWIPFIISFSCTLQQSLPVDKYSINNPSPHHIFLQLPACVPLLIVMASHQLPEVLFALGTYLDASQVLQCSRVCRAWYEAFAPLVWEDLHVHTDPLEDRQDLLYSSLRARYISFRNPQKPSPSLTTALGSERQQSGSEQQEPSPEQQEPSPEQQEPGRTAEEVGLSEFLQSKGPWLRSICYHGHGSTLQFSLGKNCTQLRSLAFKGPFPFQGNKTSPKHHGDVSTRALRIHGDGGGPYSRDYQERCKVLLRQNREYLQHLSLRDFEWNVGTRLVPGYPTWTPLFTCSSGFHHLQSLSLIRCGLRGREVNALWAIGPTLEKLTLHAVTLNIGHWMHRRYLRDKSANVDQQEVQEGKENNGGDDVLSKDRVFPRLRELHLCYNLHMGRVPQLLEYIVKECPRLQTLVWRRNVRQREFAKEAFVDILEEGFWPDLNSITFDDQTIVANTIMNRILTSYRQSALTPPATPTTPVPLSTPTSAPSTPLPWHDSPKPKRPLVRKSLTRIDVSNYLMDQPTFDLLKDHFATLRHVNLMLIHNCTRAWVLEVLTNCPTLEVLQSNMMAITDFVDFPPDPVNSPVEELLTSGKVTEAKANKEPEDRRPTLKKPWVCKNLQELYMNIEMEILDPSFMQFKISPPDRPYTPEELRLASLFFQQLGKLTRLRVFNMSFHRELTTVPRLLYRSALPIQLCAGLGYLHSLTSLEVVRFVGHQDMNLWDLQWMLDHWPALKEIGGCPLSTRDDPDVVSVDNMRLLIYDLEFERILQERGVKKMPWPLAHHHRFTCSQNKLSDLDQECVARWREKVHLEADEWRKTQQDTLGVHGDTFSNRNDLI